VLGRAGRAAVRIAELRELRDDVGCRWVRATMLALVHIDGLPKQCQVTGHGALGSARGAAAHLRDCDRRDDPDDHNNDDQFDQAECASCAIAITRHGSLLHKGNYFLPTRETIVAPEGRLKTFGET